MSDKCSHNNHTHFLLWMFILSLCFNSSCVDCSGDQARTKNSISSLNNSVYQLQNEVSLLKGDNSTLKTRVATLEAQLTKSSADNSQLKEQLDQLRNLKKGFYK